MNRYISLLVQLNDIQIYCILSLLCTIVYANFHLLDVNVKKMNISCSKDGTVSELQDSLSVQLLKHQSKINQLVDGCLLEEKQRQVREIIR